MSRPPPRILATREVARSRLFRIESVDLAFANGTEVTFERLMGSAAGAVLVVPVNARGEVLFIREYSVGTERYELGLPKGRLEPGEDLLAGADRELREEVGMHAARLEPLKTLTIAPAYFGHRTQVVLARELSPAPLPGDEPEPPEVLPWPLDDFESLLAREDFSEARSIAALYLARRHLREEGA